MSQGHKRKSNIAVAEKEVGVLESIFSVKDTSKKSTPKKRRQSENNEKDVDGEKDEAIQEGKETAVVNGDTETRETRYWLMKAEPDTRIVKGKVCVVNCAYLLLGR